MTLFEHLSTGCTTVCRCWALRRQDGVILGFTDHDLDLEFEGVAFRAGTGLSASALSQSTGLSVDNGEAVGALSAAAVTEADLRAGRYDAAEVRLWLVNWADPDMRMVQFRGSLGEVSHSGGQFRAELRGLTEALNQPYRRVYQRECSALLGDGRCRVDLSAPAYSVETGLMAMDGAVTAVTGGLPQAEGWFDRGEMRFLTGAAAGLSVPIRADLRRDGRRLFELWRAPGAMPMAGDRVRIVAGCDRQAGTCREKFGNFLNFRGFPDIPGEDWAAAVPSRSDIRDGGSRRAP